jgi:hypothetical protein
LEVAIAEFSELLAFEEAQREEERCQAQEAAQEATSLAPLIRP